MTLNLETIRSNDLYQDAHRWENSGVPARSTKTKSVPNTEPVTINFSATLGSLPAGSQAPPLPASASGAFTPIDESITFPPGLTSETVSIPIDSGAPNPGEVPIALLVTAPTSSIPFSSQPSTVYLVDGPQALPPTITSVRLITTGRRRRASPSHLASQWRRRQSTTSITTESRQCIPPTAIGPPRSLSRLFRRHQPLLWNRLPQSNNRSEGRAV